MTETDSRDGARMGLSHVVELTRRHLDLDVAFIVELAEESRQVYRAVAGDAAAFGIVVGEDALATARAARVETCVEVPMLLSDGGRYGTLCGLSRAARPDLGTRDTDFMSMLGEVIIEELDALREQQQLYTAILRLIETEDLKVAYQPIIDLRSGQCLGVEALARFPKPFTRPDVTLAAATRLGLGLELERLVIREAWKTLPKLGPGQYLALNVSPHVLVELARRANLRDDLPLSQLVVEVTEHSVVDCYAPLLDELAPLRERGLRIAVDDAGAGYASLRHVLELRPDIVKVDRSLIHGIAGDHAQRVAVGAFLSLATQLRACVVAEGVERHSDLEVACELGLHAAQGYLLGRPSTSEEMLSNWIGPRPGRAATAALSPSRMRRPLISPPRRSAKATAEPVARVQARR